MKKIIGILFILVLSCASKPKDELQALRKADMDIVGSWNGNLETGGQLLPIVFHFTDKPDGTYSCTMDSPNQSAFGLAADSVLYDGKKGVVSMHSLDMTFSFELKQDKLSGDFLQRGTKLSLVLVRGDFVQNRPQTPVGTQDYNSIETKITVSQDCTLAGTLTWPKGKGPFTVVIFLTGSGAQTRDEEISAHKPFLVIADYLARQGIASLRMDDRGTGKSTGDFQKTGYAEFIHDAALMYHYILNQKNFQPGKIGFLGHSEGGAVAPLVTTADSAQLNLSPKALYADANGNGTFPIDPKKHIGDFLILLAPPAMAGRDLLVLQTEAIMQKAGQAQGQIDIVKKINKELYDIVFEFGKNVGLEKKVDAYLAKYGITGENAKNQKATILSPAYIDLIQYEPKTVLPKITVPVLCLFGSLDVQVPAEKNMESASALIPKNLAGRKIETVSGANHLFQKAETGAIEEYSKIEQTIMPEVLERIAEFVLRL